MKLLIAIILFFSSFLLVLIGLESHSTLIQVLFTSAGVSLNILTLNYYDQWREDILPSFVEGFVSEIIGTIAIIIGGLTFLFLMFGPPIIIRVTTFTTAIATIIYAIKYNKRRRPEELIRIEQLAMDIQDLILSKIENLPYKVEVELHSDKDIIKGKEVVFMHVDQERFQQALNHIAYMVKATNLTLPESLQEEFIELSQKYI